MKGFLFPASLLACALASTNALAESAYVAADIGGGHASVKCQSGDTCSNTTAWKATGGFRLATGVAAEIGYVDFGKIDLITDPINGISADTKARAYTFGLALDYAYTPAFTGGVRLGVANVTSKVEGSIVGVGSASLSHTKTEAYYGAFGTFAISKIVKLEVGADWTHAGVAGITVLVRTITAGVRFDF